MSQEKLWVEYEPSEWNGKRVVFLTGDEEYRSEEGLPQLAKILSQRHGFRCTVLFSINDRGEIDPEVQTNQPGLQLLKEADLVVIALRFRRWPDEQMRYFDEYLITGKPILALRTSTHAFDFKSGTYERYGWQSKTWPGGFGKHVLGETWISHWGIHGRQATRGIPAPQAETNPLLNGVEGVFGTTDVYEVHLPSDARVVMFGEVVEGMSPNNVAATGTKRNALGIEQEVNNPMMPIVWTRQYGKSNTLTCTMGAATDLTNEGLRRLLTNACYWLLDMKVPSCADAELVGEYKPSPFGFGTFKKGVKPSELSLLPASGR